MKAFPARIVFFYGLFSALWIFVSGVLLHIVVDDPVLQGRIELAKGLLFVVVSSGCLYFALRQWPLPVPETVDAPLGKPARRYWAVLALAFLASIVPLAGYVAMQLYGPQIERDALANLEAIAELKTAQIESWFNERYNDGAVIMSINGFIRQVVAAQAPGGRDGNEALRESLIAAVDAVQYDSASVIDPTGRLLLSIGERTFTAGNVPDLLARAFTLGRPVHSDVFLDAEGLPHVDFIVPLMIFERGIRQPVGAVILHVAPEDLLFPSIRYWPTASRSGEALLIRQEGEAIRFLHTLRHQQGNPTVAASSADALSATAVREARVGSRSSTDYRGVHVFAAYRPVTGTDWIVVAKVDRDEAMAPLRNLSLWVSLIALLAIAAVSGVMLLFWRQRNRTLQLEMQAQSDRLLRQFYDLPFIGIAISSPVTRHWVNCNDRLCEILGYSRQEMDVVSWQEMTHPDDLAADVAEFERMMRGEIDSYMLDKRFVRKDGVTVFTSIDAKCVRNAEGQPEYVFATVQDITERKLAEAQIRRLTHIYAALSESNQAIVRCTSEDELCSKLCRIAVEYGGMKMAWIGMLDPGDRIVRPVASYGEGVEYLQGLELSADPDHPGGRGVTGNAIRENQAYWVQDFLDSPLTVHWRTLAEQAGWGASAVLPLTREARVVGVLMLYAGEAHAFDEAARNLLIEMAGDISFALDAFAKERERRQMEEQLRLASIVFAQSAEGILVTDAEHRILMVNQAFSKITGFSAEEVAGENPRLMASGNHDEHFYRLMWESVHATGHWQGEMWNRRKNGDLYPELVSISRVLDAEGRPSHYVGIFSDISQHKANEAHIHRLAQYDALTGLPNRALLADRVVHELSRVERGGQSLALVFLDLDRFKNVNDSLGHRIGDALLIQVAERLKHSLRDEDTVSRLGGDEFILVLPGVDASGAAHVAEKLLRVLSSPYLIEHHELTITPSLGLAMYPVDGTSYEELSMCADTAMYRAKQAGRHTYRFFMREMQERTDRALQMENALRRALDFEQLYLHYQPQLSTESGEVLGVEALLRWKHPDFGMVPPGDFIPVAEDSGLILPIGEWVLRTAVRQMAAWLTAGLPLKVMAVNLSAVQFRQANLPERVSQILEEYGLPPHYLELELTEGVAMDNPLAAIEVMNDLHARGVRMSIDDFGTGYSSLSYLKRFKVYKLKIDQSFVHDISTDPEDEAIVDAIIGLSNSLGLQTIAEGVETAEQLAFLRAKGCNEVQGYYFARPMPAADFERFMWGGPLG